jgi:DNA-binding CsgD family transcriptional regulator
MPYSDKNKKAERARLRSLPPYDDADLARYALKYDDEPDMIFINELWYVNGSFQFRNIYCNKAALAETGYTMQQMIAKGKNVINELLHPDDRAGVRKMSDILHSAEDKIKIVKTIYRIKNSHGDYLLGCGKALLMKPAHSRSHGVILNYFYPFTSDILKHPRFRICISQIAFRNNEVKLCVLSPRERDVVRLISKGFNNNRIAGILIISVKTVEAHRANITKKLELCDDLSLKCLCCQIGPWLNELGESW